MVLQKHIEGNSLNLPISTAAQNFAQRFSAQHPTRQKSDKIRLNTLAICVVFDYLQLMDIPAELTAGDSWNPVMRLSDDVADLVLTGLGRLECRPVLPNEQTCSLPPEVWLNRIGYIVVRIDEAAKTGTLLGFVPPFDPDDPLEEIQIADLQSLEAFLDYIGRLEDGVAFLQGSDAVAVGVREVLEVRSLSEIVAQFERIYRTCEEYEWRYAGGDVLAGSGALREGVREEVEDAGGELEDLAESLLEKLREIWGESV